MTPENSRSGDASDHACRNPKSASSEGLAGRKFSKAKTIAAHLGVCPRTIFRWADGGKITRHKINARVVLFDEAEVVALIEGARLPAG